MEKNRQIIEIAELKKIVNMILDRIENDLEIKEVELTEDYYWDVAEKVLYIREDSAAEIYVGSLCEDLEFLRPLLLDKDRAVSLMLIHVAPLLRYLALKVGR